MQLVALWLRAVRSVPVWVYCLAFIAAASIALMVPKDRVTAGPLVVVDQQNLVVSVAPDSTAWGEGIRPGWHLVGVETAVTYYGDDQGSIRSVPNQTQASETVNFGEVAPSFAVLALAAILTFLRLRRTGASVAVIAAVLSAPVFSDRFGAVGDAISLVPLVLGAEFTWRITQEINLKPAPSRPIMPFLGRLVVPFIAAPLIAFSLGVMALGIYGGVAAGSAAYLGLAWICVLRWRLTIAQAEVRADSAGSMAEGHGRLAVARALLADLLPFSDRVRRRGAQAERNRLASDLHAELLPAIALTASELDRRGAKHEAARLRDLASSVRNLVSDRRLPILDREGLVAAAEWLAESLEDRAGTTIELNLDGSDGSRLPTRVERAAYRVLQLSLDNVIRHSGATHTLVRIEGRSESLLLSVEDDGQGVALAELARSTRSGHLGFSDMHAEAEAIGASLAIRPRLPNGSVVTMKWRK